MGTEDTLLQSQDRGGVQQGSQPSPDICRSALGPLILRGTGKLTEQVLAGLLFSEEAEAQKPTASIKDRAGLE